MWRWRRIALGPAGAGLLPATGGDDPNFVIQEMSLGIHYNAPSADLLTYCVDASVFDIKDGSVAVPSAPGLGIEIDEAHVREAAKEGHRWRNPVWRGRDGSLREW
jgi:galactonate dehydratase